MYRPPPALPLLFCLRLFFFRLFLFWQLQNADDVPLPPLPREFYYAVPRDHNCDKRENKSSKGCIDLCLSL